MGQGLLLEKIIKHTFVWDQERYGSKTERKMIWTLLGEQVSILLWTDFTFWPADQAALI